MIQFFVLDPSKFDENNRIIVNDHLQIEGLNGVYAIGDCCNKTAGAGAAMAGDHAKLVTSNLVREIKGQCLQKYAHSKYLPNFSMSFRIVKQFDFFVI